MFGNSHDDGIKILLKEMIAKHGLDEPHLDALLEYAFNQTNNNEQEAISKLSIILGQNLPGVMQMQSVFQIELQKQHLEVLRHNHEKLEQKIIELSQNIPKTDMKLLVVQGVFTALSFIASTVAFLKAFGIITLNIP